MNPGTCWKLFLLSLSAYGSPAVGVMPTGQLQINDYLTYFAAPAAFGAIVPAEDEAKYTLLTLPSGTADGCDDATPALPEGYDGAFAVLAQRGNCSFDTKARTAQAAGAALLIVYNTLEGVYQGRGFAMETDDYECANGEGWISSPVSPAWHPDNDDPTCSGDARCQSGVCAMTNVTDAVKGTRVCCAWDLYVTMGASDPDNIDDVTVLAAFMTMQGGNALVADSRLVTGTLMVRLEQRPRSDLNISSIVLWLLGVLTVAYAAYRSGDEARYSMVVMGLRKGGFAGSGAQTLPTVVSVGNGHSIGGGGSSSNGGGASAALDLGLGHTVGFVGFASCMLLVLFFFDLNLVVTLMFCVSATSALATVCTVPLLRPVFATGRRLFCAGAASSSSPLPPVSPSSSPQSSSIGSTAGRRDPCEVDCGGLGRFLLVEIVGWLASASLVLHWFLVRKTAAYAWVIQDLCGCCLCVLFLATIRVSTLRIATALLSLAFFYDIFWVFLSPLLLGDSVMVEVATGGGPKADAAYCEKYPDNGDCYADSLPMLLQLPRIGDYLGGYVMLGLGDIVLPGLLLSFAHRYDIAAQLPPWRGYFPYMLLGYAAGLMMANVAVYVMEEGQPALLYLVPCTLGLFCFIAWMDGSFPDMWRGPPELTHPGLLGAHPHQQPRPLLFGMEVATVGADGEGGDGGDGGGSAYYAGYRPIQSPSSSSQAARRGGVATRAAVRGRQRTGSGGGAAAGRGSDKNGGDSEDGKEGQPLQML